MRKVLIAFDGVNYSEGACEFARLMNEQEKVMLVGLFLPRIGFSMLLSRAGLGEAGEFLPWAKESETKVEENINRFESFCRAHQIHFQVHRNDAEFALPALEHETRFADLMIVGIQTYYEGPFYSNSEDYRDETLAHAQCPVILVPEKFEIPETNIIAYDGHDSSTYAMKQFSYLFPALAENKTIMVYANKDASRGLPDSELLAELTSCHFPQTRTVKLDIDPRKYFATWLSEQKKSILISGGFGRPELSRFFKKSFLQESIRAHNVPLFIAHS